MSTLIAIACICMLAAGCDRQRTEPVSAESPDPSSATKSSLPRIYQAGPHTRPLPEPRPGDWLAEHPESGQTFDEFVAFDQRVPVSADRRMIVLQPIGEFSSKHAPDLEALRQFTAAFFQLPVAVRSPIAVDEGVFEARESHGFGPQLLTHSILERLGNDVPPKAYCVLGVTMFDLYPDPEWNFVFGQASFTERVGVFSFARHVPSDAADELTDDQARRMLLRNYKTLSHEIGHMFGMKHCTAHHCRMNGSNGLWESDAAPLHVCPVCLRKLQYAVRFDPFTRYQQLEEILAEPHPQEASWYRERRRWAE